MMQKALNVLLIAVVIIVSADLLYFLANGDRFVLGSEAGGGWKYQSREHFIWADGATILLALTALGLSIAYSKRRDVAD